MTTSLTRDGCVPRILYTSDKRKGSSCSPPIAGATQERRPIRVKHDRGGGGDLIMRMSFVDTELGGVLSGRD